MFYSSNLVGETVRLALNDLLSSKITWQHNRINVLWY
jgi:hypothetical protein